MPLFIFGDLHAQFEQLNYILYDFCSVNVTIDNMMVRTYGGVTGQGGIVKVRHNGAWHTVCDDLWDDADAT